MDESALQKKPKYRSSKWRKLGVRLCTCSLFEHMHKSANLREHTNTGTHTYARTHAHTSSRLRAHTHWTSTHTEPYPAPLCSCVKWARVLSLGNTPLSQRRSSERETHSRKRREEKRGLRVGGGEQIGGGAKIERERERGRRHVVCMLMSVDTGMCCRLEVSSWAAVEFLLLHCNPFTDLARRAAHPPPTGAPSRLALVNHKSTAWLRSCGKR